MKITLSINSKYSVELNYRALANCLDDMGDEPAMAGLFNELADHPSGNVRYVLAMKKHLPIEALERLADDPNIEIMREVAKNKTALRLFKSDLLIRMIERDECVALELADRLSKIENGTTRERVINTMRKSRDPELAAKIATYLGETKNAAS